MALLFTMKVCLEKERPLHRLQLWKRRRRVRGERNLFASKRRSTSTRRASAAAAIRAVAKSRLLRSLVKAQDQKGSDGRLLTTMMTETGQLSEQKGRSTDMSALLMDVKM